MQANANQAIDCDEFQKLK
jgi:uncharacterized protein with WD repeat